MDEKKIANDADMIINGYAFTKDGDDVRVLNLHAPDRANREAGVPPGAG